MILRAISSHKELQTPTNLFLASLAMADLLITLLAPIDTVSVISVYKELQTPTNLFLASLAIADLLITVFMPINAVSDTKYTHG